MGGFMRTTRYIYHRKPARLSKLPLWLLLLVSGLISEPLTFLRGILRSILNAYDNWLYARLTRLRDSKTKSP